VGTENVILKFLLRHPLVCVFALALIGLSVAVISKVQDKEQGGGMPAFARGGAGGATAVTVAQVTQQLMFDQVESVGTAVANESVNLTPKVSDTISRVGFQDGDLVRAGDILVELTNASETARLSEAQSTADEAVRQYERLRTLNGDNLISATDLDAARTRAETAQARLEGVIVAMDDRLIRAPFSGVLGFRNVSEGSLVSPNTIITTLDDISVIKLDFSIAEAYLAQIASGQTIRAESIVYRGRQFDGTVQVVGSRIDPVTRSVQVRAVIDNSGGELRPGMLMTVSVALNSVQAVVVPEQSLVPRSGKQFVFVVDEANVAKQVEVVIGRRRPGIVEIIQGVSLGDMVVTEGLARLRPGQTVQVLKSANSELTSPAERSVGSDAAFPST
tara:strand:+ start:110 stop:1276 length:1167 start_codon:yes stop_codon:yes gene_type:complete